MAERSPSIQFYFRQFSGDEAVRAMDLDTVGAHILLMCAAGSSSEGFRLPNDDTILRNLVGRPSDEVWQKVRTQLLNGAWKIFVDSQDKSWLIQQGMRRSLNKQKAFRKLQSSKGIVGNEVRWGSRDIAEPSPEVSPNHRRTIAGGIAEPSPSSSSSSSSSITPLIPQGGTLNGDDAEETTNPISPTSPPPPSPPPHDSTEESDAAIFRAAWAAFNRWSVAATRFPIPLGHNHEHHVRRLLLGLQDAPLPIIHGGQPVAPALMIPMAVDFHVTAKTQWKSTAYAVGCVKSKLDEWAREKPPESAKKSAVSSDSRQEHDKKVRALQAKALAEFNALPKPQAGGGK